MDTKKKLTLTIVILSVVIVLAIGALVVALVLSNQTANTSVKIYYESDDVYVRISASAYLGEDKYVFVNGDKTSLDLSPTSPMGELSQPDSENSLKLSEDKQTIVFEYKFVNLTDYIDTVINLTAIPEDVTNITVGYTYSSTPVDYDRFATIVLSDTYEPQLLGAYEDGTNTVRYIYIVATITDDTEDAKFKGDFEWDLERADSANVNTVTLNSGDTVNGVASTTTLKVVNGTSINQRMLPTPAQNNKAFAGWSVGGNAVTFPYTVNANVTLTPVFKNGNVDDYLALDNTQDCYYVGTTKYSGSATELVIPDYYEGKKVVYIADGTSSTGILNGNTTVTSVYVGNNVANIGEYAFYNCTSLANLYVPDNTAIAENALYGCSALNTFEMNGVTYYVGEGSPIANANTVAVALNASNLADAVDGDKYLDTSTSDVYERKFGHWIKTTTLIYGKTAHTAIKVGSASHFYEVANTTENTYIELINNIDLNDLNDIFATKNALIDKFVGQIDGAGYTINMNTVTYNEFSVVIDEFNAVLKNVTLNFDNIATEVAWASECKGEAMFKDVTTLGHITLPTTSNYSPLIAYANASLTFMDCTNALNIDGLCSYGSPFFGGYIYDNTIFVLPSGRTRGVATAESNIHLNFIRCTNTANIIMTNASFLYGNMDKFPYFEYLTIDNCVNEGTIVGRDRVDMFCGMYRADEAGYYTYVPTYYAQVKEKFANDLINRGDLKKIGKLSGLTISKRSNQEIIINNTTNNGNAYSYKLIVAKSIDLTNGTRAIVSIEWDYLATSANVNTGIYNYLFIDQETYSELNSASKIASKTEITTGKITKNNVDINTAKFYIVTTTTGETYYYIDINNGERYDLSYTYINGEIQSASKISVTAYDTNGTEVAYM